MSAAPSHGNDPATVTTATAGVRARIVRGVVLLCGGEMVAKVFTLLAFTHLGRLLGPGRYGGVEFVLAMMVFFTLPVDSGLGTYGAREIARGRAAGAGLLVGIASLRLLLALGSFIALMAIVPFLSVAPEVKGLLAAFGVGLLVAPGQLQWFFQGHGKVQWVAAASIVRNATFAALVFLAVRPGVALAWVGAFECAALLAASALCLWAARAALRPALAEWPPRRADLAAHLGRSWPIGASELASATFWYLATVFLGLWVADASLGWFGASHRIVMALHTFVWLYFYNLFPILSRSLATPGDDPKRLLGWSLALTSWGGILGALLIALLADELMVLAYGPAYRAAGRLLSWLVWIIPVSLVSGHYRYALIASDRERQEFRCNAVGATVALALGVVLVPRFGAGGAVAVLVAAAITVLVLAYASARLGELEVPSLLRGLPAAIALGTAWLVARGLDGFGPWVAAAGGAGAFVLQFALFEARGLLSTRLSRAEERVASTLVEARS